MYNRRKVVVSLLTAALLLGGTWTSPSIARAEQQPKSKNLIILIGDGMGLSQVAAARTYLRTQFDIEHLNMDDYFIGQATTYAAHGHDADSGTAVSGVITDSSAAATAFASGTKTYNAAVGVTNENVSVPLASIIEAAKLAGKATGLVSTTRLTHATPAAFAAHVRNRTNENAIASQLLESGVDVMLSGGKRQFVSKDEGGERTDRSILSDFEKKGYKLVQNREGLLNLEASPDQKVLGLFSDYFMPYVLDRQNEHPSLEEMTKKTLELLAADKEGFVVMIEGGRIDMASHANDFPTMIQEVLELDRAIGVAMDFAKTDQNTSVIVTADHETGGLALGRDSVYEMNTDLWDTQANSHEYYYTDFIKLKNHEEIREIARKNNGITNLTDEEAEYILHGKENSEYLGAIGRYNRVIAKRMSISWSGYGHTATDVGIWAYGPIADLVKGHIDNTDIAQASSNVLGINLDASNASLRSKYLYPEFIISKDGKVVFPARELAEFFGADVQYSKSTKVVSLHLYGKHVDINLNTLTIDTGEVPVLSDTAELKSGLLYLTLEVFEKLVGQDMEWDTLSERIVVK
ncbi:alkaline phosphatase [Paenibacillus barcinonensis]|uniref:alkaline phosphatase n=1 Tax=Paenibacillus barcinonensis TaxID=198119 RepID=UPI001C129371|nr:alkaline phosphatase [Paenibacillus barcinonensis]MBU5351910.1 alkaline phosphatase [Paenibacillus barcinonensis]